MANGIDELPKQPGPGFIEQRAIAAGCGEGAALAAFRRGYADRGRYGAKGEAAGIVKADEAAYMIGLNTRLAVDLEIPEASRPEVEAR